MRGREDAATGLLPLYVAIGALFAALGLWVLLAAPKRNLNRALAAVLILWAGSSIVFQLMRDATTVEAHAAYRAVGSLYEVPTPFLFVYVVDELFLPKPRSRVRKAALAGLAVFAVLVGAQFLSDSWLEGSRLALRPDGAPVLQPDGAFRFIGTLDVTQRVGGGAVFVSEAVAVVIAARSAAAAPPGSIERRRAAVVALAFAFLAGHNGGLALGTPLNSPALADFLAGSEAITTLALLTGAVAVAYAAPRVAGAWQGQSRVLAWACVLAPVLAGFFDADRVILASVLSGDRTNTRFIWVSAFAIGLAVAVLRYDLAAVGGQRSARRAAATAGILAFGVAGVAAGYAVSAVDLTPLGLSLGAAMLASPAVLALPPLRQVPRRLAAMMTLDPRDPALDRERARIYASALRAAAAEHGSVPAAGDPALGELRDRLGLGERDHELLASALDTRAESLAPGTLFLGRYRLVRELGRGGFGEAFLARDEREGRDVVLKRLHGDRGRDAEALRRFQREARLAATVEHPNIVTVHGTEAGPDGAYLVMEYLAGGSLADRLRVAGPLSEAEAVAIARDALAGLGALHARGILHRDVKPGNILLTADGRAKLGDFTIAREVVSGVTEGAAGRVPLGTLAYIAPEQARGMPATPQTDLYSLGASIYEALAGRPPVDFQGLTDYEAALRVAAAAPPPSLPAVSAGVNAWLAAALAKDPQRRPADARAMGEALDPTEGARAGARAGSSATRRRRPA